MAGGGEKPLTVLAEAMHDLAVVVNSGAGDLELAPLSYGCSLVLPLIKLFGAESKLAEMEYAAKVDDLMKASETILTLSELIDADIENNSVKLNGSHSRNLLRMKRALEMVKLLFELIQSTTGNSLEAAFLMAYLTVFAPYHELFLRDAATEVMQNIPTKEQLLVVLNEDEESSKVQLKKFIDASATVTRYIDEQFTSKGVGIDW